MNNKINHALISFALSTVLLGILYFVAQSSAPGSGTNRLAIMLGGHLPYGVIQGLCYFLFFFAILEIQAGRKKLSSENNAFSMQLLPEKEQYILTADDVNDIKLKMVDLSKTQSFVLIDVIKKACTKFRANKSVSEAMDLLSAQTDINLMSSESDQSMIRYSAWAIPSIGFIGTVIGIAGSLELARDVVTQDGIDKVTQALSVAFDTTLVALLLSIILMFLFHILQEETEKFHAHVEEYVLDNLVNRIYHR